MSLSYNIGIIDQRDRTIQCTLYIPVNDIYTLYKKQTQTFQHQWITANKTSQYAQFSPIYVTIGGIRHPLALPASSSPLNDDINSGSAPTSSMPFNIDQKSTIQPIICYNTIKRFINKDYEKLHDITIQSMTIDFTPLDNGTKYDLMPKDDFDGKYTVKTGSMDDSTYVVTFDTEGQFEVSWPIPTSYETKYWVMRATIQTTTSSTTTNNNTHDDSIIYTIYQYIPSYSLNNSFNSYNQVQHIQTLRSTVNISSAVYKKDNKSIISVSPLLGAYSLEQISSVYWPNYGHWYKYVDNITCTVQLNQSSSPEPDYIIELQPSSYMGIPNLVWRGVVTNILTATQYPDNGIIIECNIKYYASPFINESNHNNNNNTNQLRYPKTLFINIYNEISLISVLDNIVISSPSKGYEYPMSITLLVDNIITSPVDIKDIVMQQLRQDNTSMECIDAIDNIPSDKYIHIYTNNSINKGYSFSGSTSSTMGSNMVHTVWVIDSSINIDSDCIYPSQYIEVVPSSSSSTNNQRQYYISQDMITNNTMHKHNQIIGPCTRSTQCFGDNTYCISDVCQTLDLLLSNAGILYYNDHELVYTTQEPIDVEPDPVDRDNECDNDNNDDCEEEEETSPNNEDDTNSSFNIPSYSSILVISVILSLSYIVVT